MKICWIFFSDSLLKCVEMSKKISFRWENHVKTSFLVKLSYSKTCLVATLAVFFEKKLSWILYECSCTGALSYPDLFFEKTTQDSTPLWSFETGVNGFFLETQSYPSRYVELFWILRLCAILKAIAHLKFLIFPDFEKVKKTTAPFEIHRVFFSIFKHVFFNWFHEQNDKRAMSPHHLREYDGDARRQPQVANGNARVVVFA